MARRLIARFVETVSRAGRYGDGLGLQLLVKPTGAKSWVQRLTVDGKRLDRGLGPYPAIGLTAAREEAIENWRAVRRGRNPFADRDAHRIESRARNVPTVAKAVEAVIALQAGGLEAGSLAAWRRQCGYIVEVIGRKAVDEVTAADAIKVLAPMWSTKPATGRRVRSRLSAIMQWAIASGYRTDDPAGPALAMALPRNGNCTEHRAADDHVALPVILGRVQGSGARAALAGCLALVAHTGVRSAEARGAEWSEFDLDARLWTLPAGRTKMGREHRVPLTDATVALLRAARAYKHAKLDLVFPNPRANGGRGGAFDDTVLSRAWKAAGGSGTIHGLRTALRSWCADRGVDRAVAEAILGHAVKGTEGAYQRSDLLNLRQPVLAEYSAYLASA